MSQDRKTVKIFSFIAFALGLTRVALVLFDVFSGSVSTVMLLQDGVTGLLLIVCSVFGIRGANKPSAIGPLVVLTTISAVASIVVTAAAVALVGGFTAASAMTIVATGVVMLLYFAAWNVLARRVRDAYANRI